MSYARRRAQPKAIQHRRRPQEAMAGSPSADQVRCYNGKVRYANRRAARAAIRRLRASGGDVTRLGSYRHEGCGGWHVGHQEPPA